MKQYFADITGCDYDENVWFDMARILFCAFLDNLSSSVCQASSISLLVYSCFVSVSEALLNLR